MREPGHESSVGTSSTRAAYLAGFYEGIASEQADRIESLTEMVTKLNAELAETEQGFARLLRNLAKEAPEPEPVEVGPELQLVIDELTDAVTQKAVEIETRKDEREGRRLSDLPTVCMHCLGKDQAFLVCIDGVWKYECRECGRVIRDLDDWNLKHYGLQNVEPEPEEIETTPENLAEVAESVLQPKEATPSVEDKVPTTQPKDPGKPLSEAIPQRLPSHSAPIVRKQATVSIAPLPDLPNPNRPWKRKHKPQVYTFAMTCLAEDPHSKAIEIAAQSQREFGPDCLSMKDAENFVAANRTAATLLSNAVHGAKVEWLGEFDRINRIRFQRTQEEAK